MIRKLYSIEILYLRYQHSITSSYIKLFSFRSLQEDHLYNFDLPTQIHSFLRISPCFFLSMRSVRRKNQFLNSSWYEPMQHRYCGRISKKCVRYSRFSLKSGIRKNMLGFVQNLTSNF